MTHSRLETAKALYFNASPDQRLPELQKLCDTYEARIKYLIQKESELRSKPQFLIDDDDEYQTALERLWAREEISAEYNDLIEEHQECLAMLKELMLENLTSLSTKIYKTEHNNVFFPTSKRVEQDYENGKAGEQLWIQMTPDGLIVQNYWTEREILRDPCVTLDLNKL